MHKEHHGFLYGILAALSSAGLAVFIKLASDVPNTTLVFARFAICLPFVFWVVLHKKIHLSFKKIPGHLIRGLAGLAAIYCYFYAVKVLPLVNAITLSNTAPLFMPLVVLVWLKLLVSPKRFWAVGIGFVGVVVLLRPAELVLNLGSLAGIASGLLAAIAQMGIRQLSKVESTETILAYYFLICSVLSFFPMIVDWEPIPNPMDWIYLLAMGVLSMIFQYTITKSFTHAAATKMSMMNYLAVVFGGFTGWLIFGEVPDYWVLLGTALIIGSALFAFFDQTPPRPLNKRG